MIINLLETQNLETQNLETRKQHHSLQTVLFDEKRMVPDGVCCPRADTEGVS